MLGDARPIHYSTNCVGGERTLWRGEDYIMDSAGLHSAFVSLMSPRTADLLDLAMSAYVVDRLEPRPTARQVAAGLSWGRRLRLSIGMRDPEFWNEQRPLIAELLSWLSDDRWIIDFRPHAGRMFDLESAEKLPLQFGDHHQSVALFSGGLDSLAGAVLAFEAGRRPLLVSAETNTRMGAVQRNLLRTLRRDYARLVSASAVINLTGQHHGEPSQRTRSFVFLALGGAVAVGANAANVEVYENGIGAIGLPMAPTQEGAHTTRAMHPKTLRLMSDLLTEVSGSTVLYSNPSLWTTKAEMCLAVPSRHHETLALSESCDTAFAHRGTEFRCGVCTSCILRRQSLLGAGLQWIDELQLVRTDVFGRGVQSSSQLADVAIMLDQVERISTAVRSAHPWAALVSTFPELLEAVSTREETAKCLRLFEAYAAEWAGIPSELVDLFLRSAELKGA